jgi:hypothetical protein
MLHGSTREFEMLHKYTGFGRVINGGEHCEIHFVFQVIIRKGSMDDQV